MWTEAEPGHFVGLMDLREKGITVAVATLLSLFWEMLNSINGG